MVGQLVLLICIAAGMTASCILFVLFGPVPVKRKVTIVPRHTPDVFAAQPTISPQKIYATAVEPTVSIRPASSPPALPRKRSARGTSSPRHRSSEEQQTDRVARVSFDTDSFLVDGS